MFRARYVKADFSRNVGIANIEKVLDELSKEASSRTSGKELASRNPDRSGSVQRKWDTSHNMGILQLLAILKEELYKEEPIICFNYFGMHKRSIELLRLIQAKEDHKFTEYFSQGDRGYLPDESFISGLVVFIHHVAIGGAAAGAQMGLNPTGSGAIATSRMVQSCGEVMQTYLRKNGDVALKETKAFCKNKTLPIGDTQKNLNKAFAHGFSLEDIVGPGAVASIKTGIPMR